jgi:diaminopimelate decarboxylase
MADQESYMGAVIIEHVNVADLPETWRAKLSTPQTAHVTVRIEPEEAPAHPEATGFVTSDPAFGIWRDREDMTDVEAYLRKLRAPRYNRDGSRNED